MPDRVRIVLRSLLALGLALVAVPLVNLAGGELAALLRLPPGGDARLAYDLLWVFLAGVAGSALMVGVAAMAGCEARNECREVRSERKLKRLYSLLTSLHSLLPSPPGPRRQQGP